MSKKSIIIQQSFSRDDCVSHYIAETAEGATSLRRGEGEEWTAWCRGEPLVDIADHGNGIHVDLVTAKMWNHIGGLVSLNLDYDVANDLFLALREHLMHTESSGGKMIIKRFMELED